MDAIVRRRTTFPCPHCRHRNRLLASRCDDCGIELHVEGRGSSSKVLSGETLDTLERLAALRERGVVSEAEFLAQKQGLIGASPIQMPAARLCGACGERNPPNSQFCRACGSALGAA